MPLRTADPPRRRTTTGGPLRRPVQITFDAHDPRALSRFWRDVLGGVIPGPPGVELPEGAESCLD